MTDSKHVEALSERMKALLQAELSAGNVITETCYGWPESDSVCVFLKYSFMAPIQTGLPGIIYHETNDMHYWKAEYYEKATRQMIACNFADAPAKKKS